MTFEQLKKLANENGIEVERTDRGIEIWDVLDHSVTTICDLVREAVLEVQYLISEKSKKTKYVVRLSDTLWLAGFDSATGQPLLAKNESNAHRFDCHALANVAALNSNSILSIDSRIEPAKP